MERYIAIDNVCAWPNLTLAPQGTILAVIFGQPAHLSWEGDCECWASEDSGLTWSRRGVPGPHRPGGNRGNHAVGLARDGSVVALVSGYEGLPAPSETTRIIPSIACRSCDLGRTWEQTSEIPAHEGCSLPVPFGDIVMLSDGSLGAALYAASEDGGSCNAYLYRSTDDGRTWRNPARIGTGINETALLMLGEGRLLAAARTEDDECLALYSSADDGRTWSGQVAVTLGGQHPAHLLRLADGRILLTYGIRNAGLTGVGYRISANEGQAWANPHLLVDISRDTGPAAEVHPGQAPTWDCGYPASVQLPDGMVVTAYYARSTPAHMRYHMGVVRWRP
jgi:hypothetical protein